MPLQVGSRYALALACMVWALACRSPAPDGYDDAEPYASLERSSDADAPDITTGGGDAAAAADVQPPTLPSLEGPCSAGETRCGGVELDTCVPAGDGWVRLACFPGTACVDGSCQPIGSNLVLIFDTSGSMSATVGGRACGKTSFPNCDPAKGCSRMDVSKVVFREALKKIDGARVSMALFRFPSGLNSPPSPDCVEGHQVGSHHMSGDPGSQAVTAVTKWYWSALHEVMAVPFPRTPAEATSRGKELTRWMDGVESIKSTGASCAGAQSHKGCVAVAACGKGACCAQGCIESVEPELRASGGTPIGKTLFYVGEYLRHRVVVDGAACTVDGDCGTPHHRCLQQRCVDPARHCRDTVVVLFTDGGQDSDPTDFFSPLPMAKRLGYGLACSGDGDCVGGAVCDAGRCLPKSATGLRCLATGAACQPGAPVGDPLHCPTLPGVGSHCLPESTAQQTASAGVAAHNVLRAPDGKPFGVRLVAVDVSGEASLFQSFDLATAAGGRVLTADTADPAAFLATLNAALDLKNSKACGNIL